MERFGRSRKTDKMQDKTAIEPVTITEVKGAGGEIQIRRTYPAGIPIPERKGMQAIEGPKNTPKEMLKRLIKGLNGKH